MNTELLTGLVVIVLVVATFYKFGWYAGLVSLLVYLIVRQLFKEE